MARWRMKDKGFFGRGPGLVEPWRIKDVRLDLEARRMDAGIECRAGEVRAGRTAGGCTSTAGSGGSGGTRDTMRLETINQVPGTAGGEEADPDSDLGGAAPRRVGAGLPGRLAGRRRMPAGWRPSNGWPR